jgi:hypothetical protein
MKKLMMIGAVTMLLVVGQFHTVSANDVTAQAEATISFETAKEVVKPNRVNPLNHGEQEKITGKRGVVGPLSLDYVSPIAFNMQKLSLTDVSYSAQADKINGKSVPNYVQLTDQRGGQTGWQLQVKQNTPMTHGSGAILKNATIQYGKLTASSAFYDAAVVKLPKQTKLNDEFQIMASTAGGEGFGTTTINLGEVNLFVPGQSQKFAGEYKTTVTYNLLAVPTK